MDVLEYYDPILDWSQFSQGDLSDKIWSNFLDLIRLCHAYKHWKDALSTHSRGRQPGSLYPQSRYEKSKVRNEYRSARKKLEGHKFRSAYLAAEKVGMIVPKKGVTANSVDYKLGLAIPIAVGPNVILEPRGYERTNFEVLAINEFDANILGKADAEIIAERWCSQTGKSC